MPGPKRTDLELGKKKGSWRTAEDYEKTIETTKAPDSRPSGLPRKLYKLYDEVISKIPQGMAGEFDTHLLVQYTITLHRYREAAKDILKNGEYQTTSTGYEQVRPVATQAEKLLTQLIKMQTILGMTPIGRKDIKISEEITIDAFKDLLG